MKTKEKQKKLTYKEILDSLTKDRIMSLLDIYDIEYKKSFSKDKLIDILNSNVDKMVDLSLSLFQKDELYNIKYLVKKKGYVKVRINSLLLKFLLNLSRVGLLVQIGEKEFEMPKEILDIYVKELKKKNISKKILANFTEYELIMGFIDAYGLISFDDFYQSYSKDYKISYEDALVRIINYAKFFNEFKTVSDKEKIYLLDNNLDYSKYSKKLKKVKIELARYTNNELIKICNLEYLRDFKSYRKLIKFVKKNYNIQNESFKIFNKCILTPYFETSQFDKDTAEVLLSALIDKYFEFNNVKHKNKFMNLIYEVSLDYPRWDLKGHCEREVVC